MEKPVFIFDFDGTIADTFDVMLKVSRLLAQEFGFHSIESHEIESFRDKTSLQVLASLKIPFFKIPRILKKARSEFSKEMSFVKPFPDIGQTLFKLKPLSQKMGIITTNSQKNVKNFLENYDLNVFDFITTTSKISQKYQELKKLRSQTALKTTLLYIGDETRDVEAAKRAGATSIAVTWGYNSLKALQSCQPDGLAHSPRELLTLCEQLFWATSEKNK